MANKKLEFPTQEWLDTWMDRYLEKHPTEKIDDFKALEEKAKAAWWDRQIKTGNPTPFDLTKEQEKVAKSARITTTEKKKTTKKRHVAKDLTKIAIIEKVFDLAKELGKDAKIVNEAKEVSFFLNGDEYSLTLTKHRTSKK